jgi:hypothetical protein
MFSSSNKFMLKKKGSSKTRNLTIEEKQRLLVFRQTSLHKQCRMLQQTTHLLGRATSNSSIVGKQPASAQHLQQCITQPNAMTACL